jgi:phosphoribosylaminoimidazolecarboxamide formyltransferase/IMP cyclohydrolase
MATILVSVFDKTGLVEALQPFSDFGHELIGSAGTVRVLGEAGISARDVAELVGGGPMLGHRVVTLSREVHAGLLARPEDQSELEALGIPRIDVLIANFYPMALQAEGRTLDSVFELMDIGGPTMVKSAIKGKRVVVVDLADLPDVLPFLKGEHPDPHFLTKLWVKALRMVNEYYGALFPFLFATAYGPEAEPA